MQILKRRAESAKLHTMYQCDATCLLQVGYLKYLFLNPQMVDTASATPPNQKKVAKWHLLRCQKRKQLGIASHFANVSQLFSCVNMEMQVLKGETYLVSLSIIYSSI